MNLEKSIIKTNSHSLLVQIHVIPNTKTTNKKISFNRWRNTIEIKLSSIPKNGKANKELLNYICHILSHPLKDINIKSGHFKENKIIELKNIGYDYVIKIFSNLISLK